MAVQRDKVIASAEKLVARGKIEPAIKEYERLLDDNPNDVNTLNRIGDLWVRINRTDEAVKVFSKIADHYSRDGFFLKAIAIYKKINKLDPSKLDVYAKLADLYARQGLAMEAKSQYQVLADYYMKHGEPANALGIYRKISELDPQSINVHVKLADLYSLNNQTAEALKEYDRVGKMLLKRGMLDEAVQVFRKALKIDARNTELVDSLVTALVEAKDFENATQIVNAALDSNPASAHLLALAGRIQLGRGDAAGAQSTLERAVAADPNDVAARDALADLYIKQGDADHALDMIGTLVERALSRGERGTAIELLNRVLRLDAGHTPTLERLVNVYTRLNEETNILASMNSLAEAHIAKMKFEKAAVVLEQLIQREPQNAQHRTKLQFVRSQTGGVDTLPPRTKAPAIDLPSMEIEEPVPSFAPPEDEDITLDLDATEPLELDLTLDDSALPSLSAPPSSVSFSSTPEALRPAVEIAAAEMSEGGDDLDFITEHLTEAEVFAKYGLAEKAAEHLRAVLERGPKNLTAHERLFRILLEEGEADEARAAAQVYVALLEERGETQLIPAVQNEFTSRGLDFEPRGWHPEPLGVTAASSSGASASDTRGSDVEISFDLDVAETEPELEFDVEAPEEDEETELTFEPGIVTGGDAIEISPAISAPAEEEEEEVETPELTFDDFSASDAVPSFDLEESAPAPALDFTPEVEEPAPQPAEVESFFAAPVEESTPVEELAEIDFYLDQELYAEAEQRLESLAARFPGNSEIETRLARARNASSPAAAAPSLLSPEEIENELLAAIGEDDEIVMPAHAPAAATAAPTASTVPPAVHSHDEHLFADEADFFDLAAELESELADEEEAISLSEEEQSLEEIFREFKKGVEQQLDSEDYDTHYNLGIAYKEMGLIDEAIGEFQLASKDPKRAVECASMLGLCFLEKGMPQLAIKWYRKGLEMPEITEDEHIGLLYDLGCAHQEVGDTESAQKAFMEVYGMNSNYRDIQGRIKQLQDAR